MYETFATGAKTMKRRIGGAEAAWAAAAVRCRASGTGRCRRNAEVEWSLRNNTNYMQTGVLSALQLHRRVPEGVLENFYRKSRNSVEAGRKDAPSATSSPRVDAIKRAWRGWSTSCGWQGIEVAAPPGR